MERRDGQRLKERGGKMDARTEMKGEKNERTGRG